MKALVLEEYLKFAYRDVDDPTIGADEVLIEVKACGICGSDVHGVDGSTGRRIPPIIMGHEASGIIRERGKGVTEWARDERVTFDSTIYCGVCWHCRRGEINLCDNRRVLGVSCPEYRRHGAFAQYVVVPKHILYRIPPEVDFIHAAMVEPLSIAMHAVSLARPCIGETAAVIGAGTIGILIIQALRAAGCKAVIAVDTDAGKLAGARRAGADVALAPTAAEFAETIRSHTEGRGVDVALEAVGVTASVRTTVEVLRKGGRMVLVGNFTPDVTFPLLSVVTREIAVTGSCNSRGDYPTCLDLIARKRVDVDLVYSGHAPLAEGAAWFEKLRTPGSKLMKVVLEP
ncbi:MAG: galactitol-1-phosphate 5-dehydrogenase [Spirochaetia bacterium]|jgi:L-iditol 2-dehydrogenase